MKSIIRNLIERLGRLTSLFILEAGGIVLFSLRTIKQLFTIPLDIKLIILQMLSIGVRSFPVVFITSIFTGMVFALQTYTGFKRFGAETMVGSVVALSMTRELGPVLTGLIVTGRAGAAIAAEIGTMRVTEQIDALETLATNPLKYLVVPRFLAGLLMLPALTVLSDIIGINGGFIVSTGIYKMSSSLYWRKVWDYLELSDFYNGLIKAGFFGASMALICSYKGFYTEGGAEGVGRSTTQAVVLASMTILVSDYFLSAWLF